MRYRFADCELDTSRRQLQRAGTAVRLQHQAFKVLTYFLEHPKRIISKNELAERVWQLAISDATIDTCIKKVRSAVGDTGPAKHIIATRHRVGYELVVPVHIHPEEPADQAALPTPSTSASMAAEAVPEPYGAGLSVAETDFRACHICRHFNHPQAAYCIRCGTRLVHACAHCVQEIHHTAAFCVACVRTSDGTEHADVAPIYAGGVQPYARSGILVAERKVVTVLCIGLQIAPGSEMGASLDLLHRQMRVLYTGVRREVDRYEGALQPVSGDHFLAVFGAPKAQEDHAQRAVLAALGLHQQFVVSQVNRAVLPEETFALRLGVHTGEVAVGGFDAAEKTLATVIGATALLATGLQEAAVPGMILCSEATARLVPGVVQVEAEQPLRLAGQSVDVYRILRRTAGHAPGMPLRTRPMREFVGRRQELATLRLMLEQVATGRGRVVSLVGEPGIGKSRLLDEFRRRLTGQSVTYLEGRCLSYRCETPYYPLLDVLRHACGLSDTDSAETIETQVTRHLRKLGMVPEESAPYLLYLLGVQTASDRVLVLPPQELKTRLYTTVRHVCVQESRQQPLVIAIEDLHWIDATSGELLTSLVEHIAGVPILLVVTYRHDYRPAWQEKSYVTRLLVPSLTFHDSRRILLEVLATAAVPDMLITQLLKQADGNPFFLEELAWTVMEQGANDLPLAVPTTIQAVLMTRIDRLSPAEKHVLQIAAVIGKDIPFPLLEAVAELPAEALQWGLDRLQSAEFLYETRPLPTPEYTFKHALTQEVAYHSLLHSARRPYHQRIAHVLSKQFPETAASHPELFAHHYTEAGLEEQAIPYWQQAGQLAVERSANSEAISHFTKGLELLKNLPDTPARAQQELTLQLAIGSPLLMLKGHTAPEVEYAYARSYELAQQIGETTQRFSVLVGLWRFYFTQARLHAAREMAEQCFRLAQHLDKSTALQEAHQILGSTFFFMGDQVAAHAHLEQGIALYNPQQSHLLAFSRGTDPGVVCLSRSAWGLWWLGYPDKAQTRSQEAIALAQRLSHPYSLHFALHYDAILHVWYREWALAKKRLEASITFMQKHGFVQFLGQSITKLGWVLVGQGDIKAGMTKIYQGLEALRSHSIELGRSTELTMLAQAYGKTKRAKEGLQVLAEAFDVAYNNAEGFYDAELYRLKGVLLLQSDIEALKPDVSTVYSIPCIPHAEEAEACFHQAITLARHQSAKSLELRAAMSLSRLWQCQGKQSTARQMLADLYNWFTEGFDTPDLQDAKALIEALR